MFSLRNGADPFATRCAIYSFEGKVESQSKWIESLAISASQFSLLTERGVFRRVLVSSRTAFRLVFVGVLFLEDKYIVSLPKTISQVSRDSKGDLALTVKAIDRYRQNRRGSAPDVVDGIADILFADDGGKLVDLFRALARWTDRYGFHVEVENHRTNRRGSINWVSTIQSKLALHGKDYVVYDNPEFRRRRIQDGRMMDYQAYTLVFLARLFHPILDFVTFLPTDLLHQAESIVKQRSGLGSSDH